MAEEGVLMMGGAELDQAAPVLSFADRGLGERNLTSLRLDSGFNEESLGWFDIADEMEVEKEEAALVVYGVALELLPNKSHVSPHPCKQHCTQTLWHNPNEHPNATRPRPALSFLALYQLKFRMSRRPRPPPRSNLRNPPDG